MLFTWVCCVATGASVHRRGRCIGVSLPLANDTSLVLVLVCLSVDVTFCFDCLHVLHAPPPICPLLSPRLTLVWRLLSPPAVSVLSSSLLSFFCVSLRVVPGGICVFLLSLAPRARRPFLFCVLLSFLVRFSVFPCCLLSLVVFPVSVLLASPAPRVVSCVFWSSLHSSVLVPPSEYLVAAVTAPLPCFHAGCMVLLCFLSVIRFMATKAFLPCVGFFTLYTMLLVTSGSLVRPYRGIHRDDDPDTS